MTAAVRMIDAMHAHAASIPPGTQKVAGYVTGTPDIKWVQADWDLFPRAGHVRIDQSPGLGVPAGSDVKDIEAGAATIADGVEWVKARHAKGWYSTLYFSRSMLSEVKAALAAASLPANRIGFWVADWSLDESEATALLGNEIVAVQWASPSSNPRTIVPGGTETLTQANVDLSVTVPWWYAPARLPQPAMAGVLVTIPAGTTRAVVSRDGGKTWQ